MQAVVITNVFTPGTDGQSGDDHFSTNYKISGEDGSVKNGEFALTFRSTLNEEFTTVKLDVYNLTDEMVSDAINSLPNKVIEDAEVILYRNLSKYNASQYRHQEYLEKPKNYMIDYPFEKNYNWSWYDTDLVILITYAGAMTTGNQYALECKTAYCADGCQPMLTSPLDFKENSECKVINNYKTAYGLNIECSGRGTCDYSSGVCSCYEGYTDEFCSTQTALI